MVRQIALYLLTILTISSLPAQAQQAGQGLPESQGHADRLAFEAWIGSLNGEQRHGAEFWAEERSKAKPVSCLAADSSSVSGFVTGCQEAQRRLAIPDVRRRTEPDYRKGWNAEVGTANIRPSTPSSASSSTQAATETWYVGSIRDRTCFLVRDAFDGARTPEEVVAMFRKGRIYYVIRRNANGIIMLYPINGKEGAIPLFNDEEFCLQAIKSIE